MLLAPLVRPVVGQSPDVDDDGVELVHAGQQVAVLRGEAVRDAALLLDEGLVAVAEVVGVVAPVELVPVEDRLQPPQCAVLRAADRQRISVMKKRKAFREITRISFEVLC